jgi:hypothetical protein
LISHENDHFIYRRNHNFHHTPRWEFALLTDHPQHVNTKRGKRTTTRRHHMRYSPPIDEDDSPDEETLIKKMYSILSRLPNR